MYCPGKESLKGWGFLVPEDWMDAKTLVGFAERPHRLGDGTHVVKSVRLAG